MKVRVDIVKVKVEVKVLNIELVSSKRVKLRVEVRLFSSIKSIDI